jgi:hypothetical protein
MQKPFNSLVVFVRNGVATPAFAVNSQLQADGREFLSLLYADPITGPQLVLAGATRKVGDVALSVPPLSVGANFGWKDLQIPPDDQKVMDEHAAALKAGEPVPVLPYDEDDLPGVHGLPVQATETDADKDARLANLAHQELVIILPVPSAPEQLDEAQGAVEPGAPESPHAIMPTDPASFESVEAAKAAALAAEQNTQRAPGPPQPPRMLPNEHPVA